MQERSERMSGAGESGANLTELLPCPFCGGPAALNARRDVVFDGERMALMVSVQCTLIDCGAEGPTLGCQSDRYTRIKELPFDAVRKWNDRAR